MPRIGALTQPLGRSGSLPRGGANIVPFGNFGAQRWAKDGRAYPRGLQLGCAAVASDWAIGNFPVKRVLMMAPQFKRALFVSGVVRNGAGAAVVGATVDLFTDDAIKQFIGQTITDGAGAYSIRVPTNATTYFARMYVVGSPDRAGTTANGLVAV